MTSDRRPSPPWQPTAAPPWPTSPGSGRRRQDRLPRPQRGRPASAQTREQVLAAVAKLGFQPNLMARNIRVGDPTPPSAWSSPTSATPSSEPWPQHRGHRPRPRPDAAHGLLRGRPRPRTALTDKFLARRISILMVVPSVGAEHSHLKSHRAAGLPVVFLDRPGRAWPRTVCVSTNRTGAHDGVAHLVAHGHRRIGFIGDLPASSTPAAERLAATARRCQESRDPLRSRPGHQRPRPARRLRRHVPTARPGRPSHRPVRRQQHRRARDGRPNWPAPTARTSLSSPSTTWPSPRHSNPP